MISQFDVVKGHDGSGMAFGSDGFLYIAVGDEGTQDGGSTPHAQKIDDRFRSGMWRIDVDMRGGSISHPIIRGLPQDRHNSSGVYQAGTLSGNPVAVAAGITTLKLLSKPGFYEDLAARTRELTEGLTAAARKHGIAFCADSEGGMFGMYFSNTVPTTLAEVSASNIDMFKVFFHAMLDEGVYFAPSAYEAGFVSATHTDDVIAATVAAADRVFAKLAKP
jgi:hypothetical protein